MVPSATQQAFLFEADDRATSSPFKSQLLKWIGNKQRQAPEIIRRFPRRFRTYCEPFLGSGGVLGVLAPNSALASDAFGPLIEIWMALHKDPGLLAGWYAERHALIKQLGKTEAFEKVKARYNRKPNGADLLFLCRACYGGVVRFRKADGYMSTPCGVHEPISPDSFAERAHQWHVRTRGTTFLQANYAEVMKSTRKGDLIYCDPPYSDSQAILYGAQSFSLVHLLETIEDCKRRGVFVALSIDGTKFSGRKLCDVPIPSGLFEQEHFLEVGRSMLKRFQMDGRSLEQHHVTDRLLLTYSI